MNHSNPYAAETIPDLPAVRRRTPPERGASRAVAVHQPPASLIAASFVLSLTAMAVITGLVGAISGDDDWMMYGFASAVLLAVLTLILSLFVIDDLGS